MKSLRSGMKVSPLALALCVALARSSAHETPAGRQNPPAGNSQIAVTSCDDDDGSPGTGTLRSVLKNLAPGSQNVVDLSQLSCSTITLNNGELTTTAHAALHGPTTHTLAIDANNASRILNSLGAVGIYHLTIENGKSTASEGGGCIFAQSDVWISESVVQHCTLIGVNDVVGGAIETHGDLHLRASSILGGLAEASNGSAFGGAANVSGEAEIISSVIAGSYVLATDRALGGALSVVGGIQIASSTIDGNTAASLGGKAGGGGLHSVSDISITAASRITGNIAKSETSLSYGGGVNCGSINLGPSTLIIDHSSIERNVSISYGQSEAAGGGAHAFDTAIVASSTFASNAASCNDVTICAAGGGGLVSENASGAAKVISINSTFSTNAAIGDAAASGGGGILALHDTPIGIFNSTIARNISFGSGAGVAANTASGGDPSALVSSIISNNTLITGVENDVDTASQTGTLTFNGASNIVPNVGASVTLPAGTSTMDPMLLALTDNGGPTQTHALGANSPALHSGANLLGLSCDQRGSHYRRESGGRVDIGAVQMQGEGHIFFDDFEGAVGCDGIPPGLLGP